MLNVTGNLWCVQVRLQTREQLLMSMIDGMAAISNCILDHAKANMTETAPGAACMALLLSVVQERERAITHNLQLVSCLRQAGLAPDTSSSLAMARQLFEPAYVQKVGRQGLQLQLAVFSQHTAAVAVASPPTAGQVHMPVISSTDGLCLISNTCCTQSLSSLSKHKWPGL